MMDFEDGKQHIAFDASVHLCDEHRRVLNAARGYGRYAEFVQTFMLAAIEHPEVVHRQPIGESGRRSTAGIPATLVDLSPLCCLMGDAELARCCSAIGICPCRFCLWRHKHLRHRYANVTCAICSNYRWIPRPIGAST